MEKSANEEEKGATEGLFSSYTDWHDKSNNNRLLWETANAYRFFLQQRYGTEVFQNIDNLISVLTPLLKSYKGNYPSMAYVLNCFFEPKLKTKMRGFKGIDLGKDSFSRKIENPNNPNFKGFFIKEKDGKGESYFFDLSKILDASLIFFEKEAKNSRMELESIEQRLKKARDKKREQLIVLEKEKREEAEVMKIVWKEYQESWNEYKELANIPYFRLLFYQVFLLNDSVPLKFQIARDESEGDIAKFWNYLTAESQENFFYFSTKKAREEIAKKYFLKGNEIGNMHPIYFFMNLVVHTLGDIRQTLYEGYFFPVVLRKLAKEKRVQNTKRLELRQDPDIWHFRHYYDVVNYKSLEELKKMRRAFEANIFQICKKFKFERVKALKERENEIKDFSKKLVEFVLSEKGVFLYRDMAGVIPFPSKRMFF